MLNPFPEIRAEERRATVAAFLTLLGVMAAHALLETARDALFLAELPARRLPWVYLTVAVVASGLFALQRSLGRNRSGRMSLLAGLLGASVITLLFWFLTATRHPWVLFALYVWSMVLATLIVVRFWTLLGSLFTVSEAKRLYAVIGVGSVLGAILGSGAARLLVMVIEPRHLLLAGAVALALTTIGPGLFFPSPETPPSRHPSRASSERILHPLRTVAGHTYLRRVAVLLLLSTVTFTLVDFVFKSVAAETVAPDRLAAFFSTVYLACNLLSLLSQLFLVGLLVRALGVGSVLSILPALLVLGGAGVAAGLGVAAAVALKGIDGGLRYSLHRTTVEVLFVPLTTELRERVKGVIEVVGHRGGQALASLGILGVMAMAGNDGDRVLAVFVVGLSLAWILLARSLNPHYLDLFRKSLSEVSLERRVEFPALDLASLEALIGSLGSPNDQEVLAALGLLAEQERTHLVPALILYHPSPPVVIRALELFSEAGREDFIPLTERLLDHDDPEVRAATLRARAWVAPSPEMFEARVEDPSSVVRSTALVGMISYGSPRADEARAALDRIAEGGDRAEQLALARAIRSSPGAAYEGVLLTLAESPHPEVREAVVLAMGEILSFAFLPSLLRMLRERNTRDAARKTLVQLGNQSLPELEKALADAGLDRRIRRQLPRVIGDLATPAAARVLLGRLLEEEEGGVRYRILRSLGRMRRGHPELELDRAVLEAEVKNTLGHIFWVLDAGIRLRDGVRSDARRATAVQELIRSLLAHKKDLAVERLFRLLGLLNPSEDLRTMYRGLRSRNRSLQSSSQELLENLLVSPLRDAVLAVVDDVPDEVRLRRAGPYYQVPDLDYGETLRLLLARGGVGTRCLVAYHAGELGMRDLLGDIASLPLDEGDMVPQVIERAFQLARGAAPEGDA